MEFNALVMAMSQGTAQQETIAYGLIIALAFCAAAGAAANHCSIELDSTDPAASLRVMLQHMWLGLSYYSCCGHAHVHKADHTCFIPRASMHGTSDRPWHVLSSLQWMYSVTPQGTEFQTIMGSQHVYSAAL